LAKKCLEKKKIGGGVQVKTQTWEPVDGQEVRQNCHLLSWKTWAKKALTDVQMDTPQEREIKGALPKEAGHCGDFRGNPGKARGA